MCDPARTLLRLFFPITPGKQLNHLQKTCTLFYISKSGLEKNETKKYTFCTRSNKAGKYYSSTKKPQGEARSQIGNNGTWVR